jgi:uncharacterized protein (DUF2235 family)
MPKNVVVLCDGTGQDPYRYAIQTQYLSNVLRLFTICRKDETQAVFYQPGIGSSSNALTRPFVLGAGLGVHRDVAACYEFLMKSYVEGDKVYLFGFSRGAYVVRAVASLVHAYGILRPHQTNFIRTLIVQIKALRALSDSAKRRKRFETLRYFFKSHAHPCSPWFVGVWDTVASIRERSLGFIVNNPSIQIGRQALAIDERRAFFTPVLWRSPDDPEVPCGPRDVKQVWFPGAHSDVGGSYRPEDSFLADVSLDWMLQEGKAFGLKAEDPEQNEWFQRPETTSVGHALRHNSLNTGWYLGELIP